MLLGYVFCFFQPLQGTAVFPVPPAILKIMSFAESSQFIVFTFARVVFCWAALQQVQLLSEDLWQVPHRTV